MDLNDSIDDIIRIPQETKNFVTKLKNLYHIMFIYFMSFKNLEMNDSKHDEMILFLSVIRNLSMNHDVFMTNDKRLEGDPIITNVNGQTGQVGDDSFQINISKSANQNNPKQWDIIFKSSVNNNNLCKNNVHFTIHTKFDSSTCHLRIPLNESTDYVLHNGNPPCQSKKNTKPVLNCLFLNKTNNSIDCTDNNKINISVYNFRRNNIFAKLMYRSATGVNTCLNNVNYYANNLNGQIYDHVGIHNNGGKRYIFHCNSNCVASKKIIFQNDGTLLLDGCEMKMRGTIRENKHSNSAFMGSFLYCRNFNGIGDVNKNDILNSLPDNADAIFPVRFTDEEKNIMGNCLQYMKTCNTDLKTSEIKIIEYLYDIKNFFFRCYEKCESDSLTSRLLLPDDERMKKIVLINLISQMYESCGHILKELVNTMFQDIFYIRNEHEMFQGLILEHFDVKNLLHTMCYNGEDKLYTEDKQKFVEIIKFSDQNKMNIMNVFLQLYHFTFPIPNNQNPNNIQLFQTHQQNNQINYERFDDLPNIINILPENPVDLKKDNIITRYNHILLTALRMLYVSFSNIKKNKYDSWLHELDKLITDSDILQSITIHKITESLDHYGGFEYKYKKYKQKYMNIRNNLH